MTENEKGLNVSAEVQLERLTLAGITLSAEKQATYLKSADDLGEYVAGMVIPEGYKKCGKCKHVLKYYLFNKNNGTKTCTTGNCKACQKVTAAKSYSKTKQKRNYREYYAKNKEMKREQARQYYIKNKDVINAKHKEYLGTKKGQKVMQKAHKKRHLMLTKNKGIPYTREYVLERDRRGGEHPICYLCGKEILDITGAACHLDHVVSIGNGGLDCFTNVAAVHHTCNLSKEKDDRNLATEQVEMIRQLSEAYIDCHLEYFEATVLSED